MSRYIYFLLLILFACTGKPPLFKVTENFQSENIDNFNNIQLKKGDLCQIDPKKHIGKVYYYYKVTCLNGSKGYILEEHLKYFEPLDR